MVGTNDAFLMFYFYVTAQVQEEVAAEFLLGEVERWQERSAEVAAGAPAAGCTPAETLARAGSGCPWRTCTACRSCRSGAAQIGLRPRHCSRPRPSLRGDPRPRRPPPRCQGSRRRRQSRCRLRRLRRSRWPLPLLCFAWTPAASSSPVVALP